MRWIVCITALLTACTSAADETESDGDAGSSTDPDSGADASPDAAGDADSDAYVDPHPIGMDMPAFALEDLNPNSATYGQIIDSAELLGAPYALIFLDSRCIVCPDVADDLWAGYQEHSTWWGAQPTYGIERADALATAPETVAAVVDGNGLPYLADTEELDLWRVLSALNHDFFAVSSGGKLDVWLQLYTWPDDLEDFLGHMTDRYGP